MSAIRMQNVTKTYDGKQAVSRISLQVETGDVYGLLGPNGSGKTTTMRLLLGLVQADEGLVEMLGSAGLSWADPTRRQVNALPESHGLYDWMRAEEYLRLFAGLYGLDLTRDQAGERLQQVGLTPGDRRPIRAYSRGMKQRLGLARAMINDPTVLLLDEPTTGLDPRGRRDIHDLLLKLNREKGTTILLSTHILDDVERLCNRIAILDKGHVRYEGKPAPEAGQAQTYRFRLDKAPTTPLQWKISGLTVVSVERDWVTCRLESRTPAEAVADMVRQGVAVAEAHQVSGGLEELYLANTSGGPA